MSTAAPALVAVHLPKTAGTSFRVALESAYGARLVLDYDDRPLTHSRRERRSAALAGALRRAGRTLPMAAVYGHFLPLKYSLARDTRYAVWLRDPVQRVVSRYHHYLRDCLAGDTSHARWGLRPGLSLEDFARIAQYQNTYREYFWLFPLRRFDFIGVVEDYALELQRFRRCFGLAAELPVAHENAGPGGGGTGHALEPAVEQLIRRCNAADCALYQRALDLPSARAG